MNIAIVYNEPTTRAKKTSFVQTEDDTVESAREVAAALKKNHHTVSLVSVSEDSIEEKIDAVQADCIFDMIEWTGADLPFAKRAVQRIEKSGIPFTGATWKNYLLVSDKLKSKRAFDRHRIPSPRWQQFITGRERIKTSFRYPVIVKLSLEHCSVGLEHDAVVNNVDELRVRVRERISRFKQALYAEEFIEGRELQVTMLEQNGNVIMLPPAEINFDEKGKRAFLTYSSRWDEDHPDYSLSEVIVAQLSPAVRKKVDQICTRLFKELGYRDYARMDLRLRGDDVFVLEANCNPGLGDCDECAITVSYKEAGMDFPQFIEAIVQSCMRRFSSS